MSFTGIILCESRQHLKGQAPTGQLHQSLSSHMETVRSNILYKTFRINVMFWSAKLNNALLFDFLLNYSVACLSPPNVKISTDQKSIKINFSHWLELKPEFKPLEYLLYLFESSPAGESKVNA